MNEFQNFCVISIKNNQFYAIISPLLAEICTKTVVDLHKNLACNVQQVREGTASNSQLYTTPLEHRQ